MEDLIFIAIGLVIIWQGYKLWERQAKLKDEMAKLKDLSIEFGSMEGDGIHLVKKNYPDLELRDDRRTGLEPTQGHSISNHMNDSDRAAKASYEKDTGEKPVA
jgi:hypothetical protein